MPQSIAFHGAARTVTGSRHLLTLDGKHMLVDCGLFQGPRDIRKRNWEPFPIEPRDIDAVILTHAHMDHVGWLPRLIKNGYSGPVYCTYGTADVARVSLPDSGRIQEEEARFRNKYGLTRHSPAEPLYNESDAYDALKPLERLRYFQWQALPAGAQFRYVPAGHILGAAMAEIYFANGERILMSGDLGRYDRPIIKDPTEVDFTEYLVLESTYGDRVHPESDPKEQLERMINDTWDNKGALLVPSFAVGRTQDLLWYIQELEDEGRIPNIPIYVDSPMANAATLLYIQSEEDHDKEMKRSMTEDETPLKADMVRFVRDREMSKALNDMTGPMMVIAGSGMLTGGRMVHHLKRRIDDPNTTVLFTGYQAHGTKGRELFEGAERISLHKREFQVRARIEMMDNLSAHADSEEILKWLGNFKEPPKRTFLVHGEYDSALALQEKIGEKFGWDVVIPEWHQSFDL